MWTRYIGDMSPEEIRDELIATHGALAAIESEIIRLSSRAMPNPPPEPDLDLSKWKALADRAISCVEDAVRETSWGQPTFGPDFGESLRIEFHGLSKAAAPVPVASLRASIANAGEF